MLSTRRSTIFKRDFKRIERRGYDLPALRHITDLLSDQLPLPVRCRPHLLKGEWAGFSECHIAPDWLLIYKIDGDELLLMRTGTHAVLFGM